MSNINFFVSSHYRCLTISPAPLILNFSDFAKGYSAFVNVRFIKIMGGSSL